LVEGDGRNRVKPSSYRDGQNVIRDSFNGRIVYMPPEFKEVPTLMRELVEYINYNLNKIPIPILASIAHYQFVTIHPYYDGNGRTARLLTNLVLYQGGYDLKGIYSLEEYYAKNLQEYYKAISIGEHHNYHFGRAETDITKWIEYFVFGMLASLKNIKKHAETQITKSDKTKILRSLTPQQRKILTLFEDIDFITSNDIAKLFNFSQRAARNLCNKLVEDKILEIVNKANRNRNFKLSDNLL
jgi:Fic family protein